ncbi:hypothetical protein QBC46DRAFT_396786 [Diplogelasinospora grovesii]|uniref:Peptidase metallopeptidase domain-containing protein n=1 Tax=Diplogelasinospora grovesii TaxID=303347 RepID=A0AAN6RZM1_9PEZI|nr:hypothetical protein QBC46DRAFT_396786 [Diplogelasinospora grovesii]
MAIISAVLRAVLLLAVVAVRACPRLNEEPPFESLRHQARVNVSHPEVQKRYLSITGLSPQNRLWYKASIMYCYDTDTNARAIIEPFMADAWNLWIMAGLPQGTLTDPNGFAFVEATAAWCGDTSKKFLLITANQNMQAFTTPGWRAPSSRSTLSFDPNMGGGVRQKTLAILAHEIGHAWGMLHEHQRPSAWSSNDAFGGTASPLAAQVTFNCENLADYQATVAAGGVPTLFCKNRAAAQSLGSSAANFLPWQTFFETGYRTTQEGRNFDWSSIMLYDSRTGSKAGGGNVLVTGLLKLSIAETLVPSPADVSALQLLYGVVQARPLPCFYWQSCSPFNAFFHALLPQVCSGSF